MGYATCVGEGDSVGDVGGRDNRELTGEEDDTEEHAECTGDSKEGLSTVGEVGIISIEDGIQRSA